MVRENATNDLNLLNLLRLVLGLGCNLPWCMLHGCLETMCLLLSLAEFLFVSIPCWAAVFTGLSVAESAALKGPPPTTWCPPFLHEAGQFGFTYLKTLHLVRL